MATPPLEIKSLTKEQLVEILDEFGQLSYVVLNLMFNESFNLCTCTLINIFFRICSCAMVIIFSIFPS